MISLDRFSKNPFDDKEISENELRAFSEDHLGKLQAANGEGEFDDMLTDTAAAHNALFGSVSSEDITLAAQKASTATMNDRLKDFVAYMTDRGEARVADRVGRDSAVYAHFFPAGKSEYHNVKVGNAHLLTERVKTTATENAAELGADFVTTVTDLANGFEAARSAQVDNKGAKTDAAGGRRASEDALSLQLFDNLLTLAKLHKNDSVKEALYFDQSLLENPSSGGETDGSGGDAGGSSGEGEDPTSETDANDDASTSPETV